MLRFVGPNGAPGTGGLVHLIEYACEYMVKTIQKVQREYIKCIVVKPEAMTMLTRHIDKYFTKTIYTQPCKSWMKRGKENGRVITLWPGSAIHAVVALENPRWEDFNYNYLPETEDNHYSYLGKGLTIAQEANLVTTEYLDTVSKPRSQITTLFLSLRVHIWYWKNGRTVKLFERNALCYFLFILDRLALCLF
ncbi:hypothetical protein N7520_003237 [Penicillium odoratum]|uniref:uncharacterized protein n=1 Tax=Penicillium odoratum TaxID=1167516 RepID=UPI00254929C2|nr:uncharacterized protein N7520_003237 [Penicillium odoratum]KAJ5772708.1 hypothetical protein N7520_003237 [Penicillium odoratum]